MNHAESDKTADLPWHIAQVYALTDTQRLELLLSFYACWEANAKLHASLSVSPTTILTKRDMEFITLSSLSQETLKTVLRGANLPIPENTTSSTPC